MEIITGVAVIVAVIAFGLGFYLGKKSSKSTSEIVVTS